MRKLSTIFWILRNKSVRLIYANFVERIIFDKLNGIDTISQVPKFAYPSDIPNLVHGLHYSSSWTSEIRFGFRATKAILGQSFESYVFVDIGCGKGKVQIVWAKMLRRQGLKQQLYGLDYHGQLLEHAKRNFRKVLGCDGNFIQADASSFNYASLGDMLIVYLYNPFDSVVISQMIDALKDCKTIVIYNNPVHTDIFLRSGFQVMRTKLGFHPQAETVVFARSKFDKVNSMAEKQES